MKILKYAFVKHRKINYICQLINVAQRIYGNIEKSTS